MYLDTKFCNFKEIKTYWI